MDKKVNQINKSKHIFVNPKIHARVKEQAKIHGKKIQHYINELIEWGLDYQIFLAKK